MNTDDVTLVLTITTVTLSVAGAAVQLYRGADHQRNPMNRDDRPPIVNLLMAVVWFLTAVVVYPIAVIAHMTIPRNLVNTKQRWHTDACQRSSAKYCQCQDADQ